MREAYKALKLLSYADVIDRTVGEIQANNERVLKTQQDAQKRRELTAIRN